MKTLLFILGSFVAQNAPAQQKATLVLPQCAQVGMVPVTTSFNIGGNQFFLFICALLDPATLPVDASTIPARIHAVVATNAGPVFVDGAAVNGLVDGANTTFLLPDTPNPATGLHLYRNGVRQSVGADFVLAGNAITFLPAATPQVGDTLKADYRK